MTTIIITSIRCMCEEDIDQHSAYQVNLSNLKGLHNYLYTLFYFLERLYFQTTWIITGT